MLYIFLIKSYITIYAFIIMLKFKNKKGSIMNTMNKITTRISNFVIRNEVDYELAKLTLRNGILAFTLLIAGKYLGFL